MDMTGQQRIPASREIVWKALNDPAVLEACIPGCQELIKTSDTQMSGLFFRRFAEEIEVQYGGRQAQHSVSSAGSSSGASASSASRPQAIRRPRPAPASVPVDVTPGLFKHLKFAGVALLLSAVAA